MTYDSHSFNISHAKMFGVHEAIIMANLAFWIRKNKANGRSFKDGRYWTYNSAKAFAELFPYMSVHQVRRALDRLEQEGVILKANYNQSAYDRTTWYAFTDYWDELICNIHLANLQNGNGSSAKPIPDINTNKKTDEEKGAAKQRTPSGLKSLQTYIDECKERDEKVIPENHHVFRYAEDAGIPSDLIGLCWLRFKEEHTTGTRKNKRQKDWPGTFANCVKDNWYGFWYVKDGVLEMSSKCELFKKTIDAQRARGE